MIAVRFNWKIGTWRIGRGTSVADAFFRLGFGVDDFADLIGWEIVNA